MSRIATKSGNDYIQVIHSKMDEDFEAGQDLSEKERRISIALHFLLLFTLGAAVLGVSLFAGSEDASSSSNSVPSPAPDVATPTNPLSSGPTPSFLSPQQTSFEAMKAFLPSLPDTWEEMRKIKVLNTENYGTENSRLIAQNAALLLKLIFSVPFSDPPGVPIGPIPPAIGDLDLLREISFPGMFSSGIF